MRMKQLAWMGCAVLLLPVIGSAAGSAESTTSLTMPPKAMTTAWSSGNFVATLDASAAIPAQAHWAITPALLITPASLWTARDAISLPAPGSIDLTVPSAAPVAPECRWPSTISNAWGCSLKPLTRYDLPVRRVLHHLWPLRGNDR